MDRSPLSSTRLVVAVALILVGDTAIRMMLSSRVEQTVSIAPAAEATAAAPVASATVSALSRAGSRGVDPQCPAETHPISHRFATGAQWQMCWHVEAERGLVLGNIVYTAPDKPPLQIINELAISQLEVPYDTGKRMTRDITDHGFGGRNMKTLAGDDCIGERTATSIPNFGTGRIGGAELREVLCSHEVDAGLGRRSTWGGRPISQRGKVFEISTISVVGWYEYMTLYSFGESGEITPRLGATGDLSPEDFTHEHKHGSHVGHGESDGAVSHSHNAVWRVHWALGGPQRVQEYNADFSGERGEQSAVMDGSWTTIDRESIRLHQPRRWWRVLGPGKNADGHPISYKIQLDGADSYSPHADHAADHAHADGPGAGDAAYGYDIAFTERDACEVYATKNDRNGCSLRDVPAFISNQQSLHDVVSWVAVSFHHVPRDEDQSPMDMHWQGFSMYPFDAFAQSPMTPPNRALFNGKPPPTPGAP